MPEPSRAGTHSNAQHEVRENELVGVFNDNETLIVRIAALASEQRRLPDPWPRYEDARSLANARFEKAPRRREGRLRPTTGRSAERIERRLNFE